ncbi:MAG: glycosyltransferase [Acidobacteriota bacterium]
MFTLYLTITTMILGALFLLALWNILLFRRRAHKNLLEGDLPFVSVLVPARNEEATIERCVRSLLAQDYPNFEVIVLDDNSTDRTAVILGQLRADFPDRLRVVRGKPLERGWVGKCFACHQLSQHAQGSWLLFTDADTVHRPHSLRTALELAVSGGADLLTAIPEQHMHSFGEKLILPLLHFSTFVFLPLYGVDHLRSPHFAIGVGQFMFFRTAAYKKIGGHAAVRNNLVEDVWLARAVKRHGFRLAVADGKPFVSCRMYRNFAEVWRGFSKNIFAGFNFSVTALAAFIALYAALFAAPFVLLGAGLAAGTLTYREIMLLSAQIAINYALRLMLTLRFRLGIVSTLLHPLGVLGVIGIALNSWRWIAFGSGARWKDRLYHPFHTAKSLEENA